MLVKVMYRKPYSELRIYQVGNVVSGTNRYCIEVISSGIKDRNWNESFKLFSDALRFALDNGFV